MVQRRKTDPACVWKTKRPLNERGLGHVTQFRNLGTPICFKFGTDVQDGASLRMDHKTTPKWAWPGSRDLASELIYFLAAVAGSENEFDFGPMQCIDGASECC